MKTPLTGKRLAELLKYDPNTGRWTRARDWYGRKRGSVAGCARPDGYWVIGIDGVLYLAHRIAFLYMTGEIPACEIDHIDGDPSNGRWSNLRACDRVTNSQNQHRAKRGRKHGGDLLGASLDTRRNTWRARIIIDKREFWIGAFETKEAAHAAYLAAKRKLHEGCTI